MKILKAGYLNQNIYSQKKAYFKGKKSKNS